MNIPSSCSLTPSQAAERRRRYAALPLIADEGGRLRYRDEPGVEAALRGLIALEAECCPGVAYALTRERDELVLTISG